MILLTGSSGFLGTAICNVLKSYEILTVARQNADITVDLSKQTFLIPNVCDIVIHCAGKAHIVPNSEAEKKSFFEVNVTGTLNLLSSLEQSAVLPKSFIFISSVAVYGLTKGELTPEDAPLLASDPYGSTKIQAEQLIESWCQKNKVICTILRLPLLAGNNPPGNLGAMIKAINKGYYFNIAGGTAKKSVVIADDVAKIIPKAAQIGGIYNLTDGYHPSFFELSNYIAKQLQKKPPRNIPYSIAKLMAVTGDLVRKKSPINTDKLKKIMANLTFDDNKARRILGWDPTPVLEGFKINYYLT